LIEDGLKEFAVAKLLCQMRDRFVRLRLPVFNVESTLDILPSLKEVLNVEEIKLEGLGGSTLDSLTQNVKFQVDGYKGNTI
jgi:hypothetical protein